MNQAASTQDAASKRKRLSAAIIAGIVVCVVFMCVCMQLSFASSGAGVAVITDGDGNTQRVSLAQDGSYTISTSLGENTVEVKDGQVKITDSDCPGHDCIEQGQISAAGEVIICLPHKLVVNIEDSE